MVFPHPPQRLNLGSRFLFACLLMFLNQTGGTLKSARKSVAPGKAVFLDLMYSELGTTALHVPIRPLVNFVSDPEQKCLASVQIFDNHSGKTTVFVSDPDQLPNPDSDPFGMLGLTQGQTAELNLANSAAPGGAACVATLKFFDSAGMLLKSRARTALPGEARFLRLHRESIGDPGLRAEIRGFVVIGGDVENQCLSTLEVFDNDSGKTTVFVDDPDQ